MPNNNQVSLLSDKDIGNIRFDLANTKPSSSPMGLFRQHCEDLLRERESLLTTVKQLRHDNDLCAKAFELDEALRFSEVGNLNALQIIRKLADLQSQLEQLRAENAKVQQERDTARELVTQLTIEKQKLEQQV